MVRYDLNPNYGNISAHEENETHYGKVPFYWFEEIALFNVGLNSTQAVLRLIILDQSTYESLINLQYTRVMKTFDGKIIMRTKTNPCEQKSNKNLKKLLGEMLDPESLESLKSFLWICPIPKVLFLTLCRLVLHI